MNAWKIRLSVAWFCMALANGAVAGIAAHVVDSIGDVGLSPIIRIGADGLPVIAYLQRIPLTEFKNLKVAKCADEACQTTASMLVVAADSVVRLGDMKVGTDGRPVIAFNDAAGPRIMRCGDPACTSNNTINTLVAPSGWSAQRVALSPTGLAFAVGARPVGMGLTAGFELSLTKCLDPSCTSSASVDLPVGAGSHVDIAIGLDGVPVVAWGGPLSHNQSAPRVARCADSNCSSFGDPSPVDISGVVADDVRLLLTPGGLPIVVYSSFANVITPYLNQQVRAAFCQDPACAEVASINAIVANQIPVDVALGADGLPLILMGGVSGNSTLVVSKCGDLACGMASTYTALDVPAINGVSMAIANNGQVVLAYFSESTADLVASVCTPFDCQDASAKTSPGQAGEPLALITSFEGDYVSLIDTVSNAVVSILPVGLGSEGVAISSNGKRAYVTNYASQTITYVDLVSRHVERTIPVSSGAPVGPRGIVVSPDESRLFVANSEQGVVAVVERGSGAVLKTIAVGAGPFGLAMNAQGTHVVAANTNAGTASIIDVQSATLLATLPVGTQPYGVAFSPDGVFAYVASFGTNKLVEIDLDSMTVKRSITVGIGPFGVAVSPDGAWAYVSDNVNQVSIVDLAPGSTVASITVGLHPQGLAVTPNGLWLYVANQFGDSVSVVDLATRTVVGNIPVGDGPVSLGAFVTGPAFQAASAMEYFHSGFGHYFVTANADEIAALDQGYFSGWSRTGEQWKVWSQGAGLKDVCRFFTVTFAPKSSHFYTANVAECALVKTNPDWQFEKIAFRVAEEAEGGCAIGVPLYRLYNNGKTGAPNHRYTVSLSLRNQMIQQGFADEGIAGCIPQ